MALPPIPTVTNIPPPPIRGTDTGLVFSNKTAAMLETLHEVTIPQWNGSIDAVNVLLPTIEAGAEAADDAETARDIAQGYASTATTQAGIATTQAGISTTQAGISTTQAGLSDAARVAAEAARDAAIGAGPLPSQAGNAGRVLTTDGTAASWGSVSWEQIASTTTGGVAQWDFTSIPQTYSNLMLEIVVTASTNSKLQLAFDHGSGFGTAFALFSGTGTGAVKGSATILAYTKGVGTVVMGQRSATAGTSATGSVQLWTGDAGISGVRVSLSAGTGSSVSIKLYGG